MNRTVLNGVFRKALLLLCVFPSGLSAQPRKIPRQPGFPPRFHDPSTPVRSGDAWWIFATGNGISTRWSNDLKTWKEGSPVFKEFPAWHREVVPDQKGSLWAPDIVFQRGVYRLYYSVSAWGKNTSAIGLATNTTLDPENPAFRWKDEGIVIRSTARDPFNAIDPQVVIDGKRQWLVFGSFWTGIQLIELDPKTGLRDPGRKDIHRIAWNETIEASAILKRGSGYYLFVNWGLCCRGLESTYEIRVGRGRSITGPYLDKDGRDMATGGGTLLTGFAEDQVGPGHASFVSDRSGTRMFYHFYDRRHGGFATLGSAPLKWSRDGWPELRQEVPDR